MTRSPDAVTYNLGHNEQMQLAVCVSSIAELLRQQQTEADPRIDSRDLENLDLETLAEFEAIFGVPGNVSVVKEMDQ